MTTARLLHRLAALLLATVLFGACGNTATPAAPAASSPAIPTVAPPTATAPRPSEAVAIPTATVTSAPPTAAPSPTVPPPSPTTLASTAMAAPAVVEVQIVDFAFEPAILTIPVGTTVVWTNQGVDHTVFSYDRILDSPLLLTGDTYTHTFTEAGTYNYLCGIHPEMEATVVVR